MTDFEALKEYEQKFCLCPKLKNKIIFVVRVEEYCAKDVAYSKWVYIKWISPEEPTTVMAWAAHLEEARETLKIIC